PRHMRAHRPDFGGLGALPPALARPFEPLPLGGHEGPRLALAAPRRDRRHRHAVAPQGEPITPGPGAARENHLDGPARGGGGHGKIGEEVGLLLGHLR
ncbi:hypothetical protein RZS08_02135, partial [Arthrospira platensis SPKY1]|nr:hypothetical protein [Arthrospira platensis SPKY1]